MAAAAGNILKDDEEDEEDDLPYPDRDLDLNTRILYLEDERNMLAEKLLDAGTRATTSAP